MRTLRSLMCLAALAGPITAHAQITGGGPAKSDCYVEWSGVTPNRGKSALVLPMTATWMP
jgi:hypothetical protein